METKINLIFPGNIIQGYQGLVILVTSKVDPKTGKFSGILLTHGSELIAKIGDCVREWPLGEPWHTNPWKQFTEDVTVKFIK